MASNLLTLPEEALAGVNVNRNPLCEVAGRIQPDLPPFFPGTAVTRRYEGRQPVAQRTQRTVFSAPPATAVLIVSSSALR